MENKNYRDHFESFLKESADSFLMVPSRKVWYSIYNDMHPDRKWPSMAVCLLILSAVMFIGVSNNNSLSTAARRTTTVNFSDPSKNNILAKLDVTARSRTHAVSPVPAAEFGATDLTGPDEELATDDDNINNSIVSNNIIAKYEQPGGTGSANGIASAGIAAAKNISAATASNISASEGSMSNDVSLSPVKNGVAKENNISEKTAFTVNAPVADNSITAANAAVKKTEPAKTTVTAAKSAAETDRSWAEDYALKHKPQMNKLLSRSSITYFVTSSLGYRHLAEDGNAKPVDGININDRLKDERALNLEAGAVVQYNITRNFRLKAGAQINYTNYVSNVTALTHTLQTSFAATPQDEAVSGYESKPGADRLNRSTVQVSIPVGADIRIAGRNKIKWYVGATVQPTYTVGGSSYVLSKDAKYYIRDKSMLRRLNLNTAVETFVSFKPSPGVTLSVGPQVRYQVMSSYKQSYNYSEKLYNVGVKVGLTTGF